MSAVRFEFTGGAREYFRIWIVNLFLSVITLGIYSAWAKVRNERYFHGNTLLDGHRFDFVADPVRILRGRLLATLALVTYVAVGQLQPQFALVAFTVLVLALPALIVLSVGFRLHNTTHRNIRFALERDFVAMYRAVGIPVLIALVVAWFAQSAFADFAAAQAESGVRTADFGMLFFSLALIPLIPYLDYVRARVIAEHARYGDQRIAFAAGVGDFYGMYVLALVVSSGAMLGAIVAGVVVGVAGASVSESGAGAYIGVAVFYALWFFVWGFFSARRRNLLNGSLRIGDAAVTSRLRGRSLGWLYLSNTVAIVTSIGLLIPWAKIRTAHYVASCTGLDASALDTIAAAQCAERTAVGEEIGEAFGYDLGF